MSERKLYFPGLGGNRYEISLEELQKQAYKGKIKRDDKIIVVKTKHGQTTEIETTCGKIRVAAEAFDQGEADRKAEAERKLAEKQAKEAERAAKEGEKTAEFIRRQEQRISARNRQRLTTAEPFFLPAQYSVTKAAIIISALAIFCAVFCYIIKVQNVYQRAYRVAYNEAYEVGYDGAYEDAYYAAHDKVAKDYWDNRWGDGMLPDEREQKSSRESEKAGKEAGKEAGAKAGKELGERVGRDIAMAAVLRFLPIATIPLLVFVASIYPLVKSLLNIPLMIAQYRTETIKLAIMNAVENGGFRRSEAPIDPVDGSAFHSFNVPRQTDLQT